MFDWFFAMPDWLYAITFGIPTLAVVLYLCRNEMRAWWEHAKAQANEPTFWELARQAEKNMRKPSGLGWPESK